MFDLTPRMRARFTALTAASLLVGALAGCGGGQTAQATAAVAGQPSPVANSTAAPDSDVTKYVDSQRQWAACLRQEGIEVSDPDATGQVSFVRDLAALKADPRFLAAQQKCRSLSVPVPAAVLKLRLPAMSAAEIETARKYADCMRRNGAPDFPAVGADGYADRSQTWDFSSPGARKATRTCAPIIGDPTDPPVGRG